MDKANMLFAVQLKTSYLISLSNVARRRKKNGFGATQIWEANTRLTLPCHGIIRRGTQRPQMSAPHANTNWLPAKSWQHFIAGGYMPTSLPDHPPY